MTEEEIKEAQAFYDSEFRGAPLLDVITFRCTKTLGDWLRNKGLVEKKDHSAVIRRLLTKSAEKEGFDKNGII
tara:strand:+ start:2742 stop:2960 length:219 start_codon:yes stop_codon:yes gene_type:complete